MLFIRVYKSCCTNARLYTRFLGFIANHCPFLFAGENYNESTALVITFVVNNHVDEAQNEKARAWELEFLRFMKNFSDPDMIIAYSAEVRIKGTSRKGYRHVW